MTELCRNVAPADFKWRLLERLAIIGGVFQVMWEKLLACSIGKTSRYSRLTSRLLPSPSPRVGAENGASSASPDEYDAVDDFVDLKVAVLGDNCIGKTSFVVKYLGDENEIQSLQMTGLNIMGKTLRIKNARISLTIWDINGDVKASDQISIACKDSVAIMLMFDLTSRCTLNSVVDWYMEARKWNQSAILVLIGTKFDEFSRLPKNLQSLIVAQARAFAKSMKATLFFSSANHNINVSKIFKFIVAKLFNLPWTVERNLTVGEPIIDF